MVEPSALSTLWLPRPFSVLLWSGAIAFYALIVKRIYERSSGLTDLPMPVSVISKSLFANWDSLVEKRKEKMSFCGVMNVKFTRMSLE
jgi:hypothetical protein